MGALSRTDRSVKTLHRDQSREHRSPDPLRQLIVKNLQPSPTTFVCHPPITPPPSFEENPVHEVVTNGLVGVFTIDGMDLDPDRVRDISDCPVHLRRKFLFTGRPSFLRRCSPQDRNRRVRPSPARDQPEQG